MEKVIERQILIKKSVKEEINWAEYLDYTKYFEPGEINNKSLDLFKKDFNDKSD